MHFTWDWGNLAVDVTAASRQICLEDSTGRPNPSLVKQLFSVSNICKSKCLPESSHLRRDSSWNSMSWEICISFKLLAALDSLKYNTSTGTWFPIVKLGGKCGLIIGTSCDIVRIFSPSFLFPNCFTFLVFFCTCTSQQLHLEEIVCPGRMSKENLGGLLCSSSAHQAHGSTNQRCDRRSQLALCVPGLGRGVWKGNGLRVCIQKTERSKCPVTFCRLGPISKAVVGVGCRWICGADLLLTFSLSYRWFSPFSFNNFKKITTTKDKYFLTWK